MRAISHRTMHLFLFVGQLVVCGTLFAEEPRILRLGTATFELTDAWKFEGGASRAEGRGPNGEHVIANYAKLKPSSPPEVTENHWKTLRGFATDKMPKIARDNGKVERPVTEKALTGGRVQYSAVSQGRKMFKDYYFLQYLFGSPRLLLYITVEGYGKAGAAAEQYDQLLGNPTWDEEGSN